jgi:hypothetical protein
MKKLGVLFIAGMFTTSFSAAILADSDHWHQFSEGKHPHAEGGCASKDKMAKFHKFHEEKGKQVKIPSTKLQQADKEDNVSGLDQYI